MPTPEELRDRFDSSRDKRLEIEGVQIKCVSSNVRRPDVPWESYKIQDGLGHEGDLVLVQAVSDGGSTERVENQYGRDERIYNGDVFIGVLANRHSGTSESGDVPEEGIDIQDGQQLGLLSVGGVVGIPSHVPSRIKKLPMALRTVGLLYDQSQQRTVSLESLCGAGHEQLSPSAPVVLVCGTSAEVGKTTTSTALIRSLTESGQRVGGTKISGTGRMRDIMSLRDAGAQPWLDFPDVGLATTYTSAERYKPAIYKLLNLLNMGSPNLIIAEAGGDPIEANVPTFLRDEKLMRNVKSVVLVGGDVMGAMGAVEYIRRFSPDMPMYLTVPKDRNEATTRSRFSEVLPDLPVFNSLNPEEVRRITETIISQLT